jgi:pimeloyl-ACP methyl ester carboxylesterase
MNKSTRRLILTGGALLAAAASGTAPTFASSGAAGAAGGAPRLDSRTTTAQHSSGGRPTIVLVHGAFADSSSWNDVVAPLKQAGYPVVAAANPLRGHRTGPKTPTLNPDRLQELLPAEHLAGRGGQGEQQP